MKFFVPDVVRGGQVGSWRAERAWRTQRTNSARAYRIEIRSRRVYSLRFRWKGNQTAATVGEADPFGDQHVVKMILAADDMYLIVTQMSTNRWGSLVIPVRGTDVISATDFD